VRSILIVDDDVQLRQSFAKILSEEGYGVQTAATGEEGIKEVRKCAPDLVIMDVRMPGMSGLGALEEIRRIEPKLPVIIMTAFGTTDTAIEATKMGAVEYVLKPFEMPDTLGLIEQTLEAGRLMQQPVEMNVIPENGLADAIVGRSKAMHEVYKSIGRVAPTDATVLICGESGTGKELVARAVYQHSLRSEKPFLVINCVAIPETLLESELFGYERGAFTGAQNRKVGKVERANGGTVFLDEIGDMPMGIQAKILRLVQEKSIERLGGRETTPVDVRIIAATNRDLEAAIPRGRFREDLYYRLKVVTIELPPLRERKGDISLLNEYFLTRFAREMGIDNPGVTDEAKALCESYSWPGNVRELANTMKKALIFSCGYPIGQENLSRAIKGSLKVEADQDQDTREVIGAWVRKALLSGRRDGLFAFLVDHFSSIVLGEALTATGGNRTQAAKLLGLSRPTLQAKIEKYRLRKETTVSPSETPMDN